MKSKLLIAGVVLLIGAGVSAAFFLKKGIPVDAVTVTRGTIQEFVEERGKTRLPRVYQISMPFDARIGAIEVLEGTSVKQGEVLAQVIPGDLKLAQQVAQAAVERLEAMIHENDDVTVERTSLEQAKNEVESTQRTVEAAKKRSEAGQAKLEMAKRNFERVESLKRRGVKTDEEFEQAQLAFVDATLQYQQDLMQLRALESTQAATALSPRTIEQNIARKDLTHKVLEKQLTEAQVRFIQAQTDAQRGVLTSPIDGVVLDRFVSDEKRVTGGTILLTVGRLEELEVETDVLSQEVVAVKPNDPVEISGPSIGPQAAKGHVSRIFPSGFTKISSLGVEQQRVKVIVDFAANETQRLLKSHVFGAEYRVRVRIITASQDNALTVPRTAAFRNLDGHWQVLLVRSGRVVFQDIEIGLMNDDKVEVRSGLDEGDVVVQAPESDLKAGVKVAPNIRERPVMKEVLPSDD